MKNSLLTYAEVAKRTGLPSGSLYSMVCRRQIPHLRLGPRTVRFDEVALEEWMAGRAVAVKGEPAVGSARNAASGAVGGDDA